MYSLSVYDRFFLIFARLNLPNVLISIAKIFFRYSDFPSLCFDVPKVSNFTSGGVQYRKTKNKRLGTIVMSFQDFKLLDKQISPTFFYFLINNALLYHFLANWLHHNKKKDWEICFSCSLKSCFLVSQFCTPPEVKFDAFGTSKHKEGKTLSKIFIAIHISILRGFNRANIKKICHIHFKFLTWSKYKWIWKL